MFLISSFQETSFNRKPFDLRDKKILKFDRDKADSLVLAKGASSIEMSRSGSEWKVVKPVPSRSDYSAIEGFLTRLSSSNMSKLIEENPKDLAKYGLDKPAMTVTIGAGSAKTVLEVGKAKDGETYAKDASRPIVFMVDTTLQGDLEQELRRLSQEGAVRVPAVLSREAARGARRSGRRQDLRVREAEAGDARRSRDLEGDAGGRIRVILPTRPRWTIC